MEMCFNLEPKNGNILDPSRPTGEYEMRYTWIRDQYEKSIRMPLID